MVNKRIYLYSIIISTIVFISGVGIGIQLNKEKTNILEQKLSKLRNEERNAEIQWLMLTVLEEEKACELMYHQFQDLMTDVGDLGERLVSIETSGKILSPEYFELKKEYSAFQIKYWLFAENIRKSCSERNKTLTTILYFYSNNCQPCDRQGFVLSYLKDKHPNIMIYSFDTGLEYRMLDNLELIFNVTKTPSLIINGERKLVGLKSFEELSEYVI